jgi:hypothetical protein
MCPLIKFRKKPLPNILKSKEGSLKAERFKLAKKSLAKYNHQLKMNTSLKKTRDLARLYRQRELVEKKVVKIFSRNKSKYVVSKIESIYKHETGKNLNFKDYVINKLPLKKKYMNLYNKMIEDLNSRIVEPHTLRVQGLLRSGEANTHKFLDIIKSNLEFSYNNILSDFIVNEFGADFKYTPKLVVLSKKTNRPMDEILNNSIDRITKKKFISFILDNQSGDITQIGYEWGRILRQIDHVIKGD